MSTSKRERSERKRVEASACQTSAHVDIENVDRRDHELCDSREPGIAEKTKIAEIAETDAERRRATPSL